MSLLPLTITSGAEGDMADIWAYIAHHNPAAANRVVARFASAFLQLRRFPELGERCQMRTGEFRRIAVGKYLVFYQNAFGEVTITRVLHAARRWEDLL